MQKVIRELSDVLGWAETIYIVRKWGGRSLRVPTKVQPGDPLALSLGYATARRLVESFGGMVLQLPSERNALLDLRNRAIYDAVERGQSHESVAIEYGLTRQHVGYLVAKMREQSQISADAERGKTKA